MSKHPHRLPIAVCVVLAVALNASALGMLAGVVGQWQGSHVAARSTSWITTVSVVRDFTSSHEQQDRIVQTEKSSSPQSRPPQTQARKDVKALSNAPSSAVEVAETPVRFYRYAEVDRPAVPDSDWNLDPASLDASGVSRLVFEIFVSSGGTIVDCAILEPASLTEQARKMLEERLRQTNLTPAMRGGAAVASVRRIELTILPSEER
jgi:hypothetical protein